MQMAALEVESFRALKEENDALRVRVGALEKGRLPVTAGAGGNGLGFAVGGIALAGAVIVSRRKKVAHS
jgi:hypothetical protein